MVLQNTVQCKYCIVYVYDIRWIHSPFALFSLNSKPMCFTFSTALTPIYLRNIRGVVLLLPSLARFYIFLFFPSSFVSFLAEGKMCSVCRFEHGLEVITLFLPRYWKIVIVAYLP
jgi:hypothetical protein